MHEFFAKTQVFPGKFTKQVADHPAVVRASGRTHAEQALGIQKHGNNRGFGNDTDV